MRCFVDKKFMNMALKQAEIAYKNEDIPVGAVLVCENKVVSKAYNKKNKLKNPLAHAEIIAINKACKKRGDFRLSDCTLYVTKEPCLMCYGTIISARIKRVVYGASDLKYGCVKVGQNFPFNHTCEWQDGVLEKECSEILTSFFKDLRERK